MDVFGSSRARAQKSDGEHRSFVALLRLHRNRMFACSLVSLAGESHDLRAYVEKFRSSRNVHLRYTFLALYLYGR